MISNEVGYRARPPRTPKFAIPMHYGTFPVLKETPEEYIQALGKMPTKVMAIKPGDRLEF